MARDDRVDRGYNLPICQSANLELRTHEADQGLRPGARASGVQKMTRVGFTSNPIFCGSNPTTADIVSACICQKHTMYGMNINASLLPAKFENGPMRTAHGNRC